MAVPDQSALTVRATIGRKPRVCRALDIPARVQNHVPPHVRGSLRTMSTAAAVVPMQ